MRDMAGFFAVVRDCGMEHIVFFGMYFALRLWSFRFIRELDRLFRAVDEMKATLTESGDATDDPSSSGSN